MSLGIPNPTITLNSGLGKARIRAVSNTPKTSGAGIRKQHWSATGRSRMAKPKTGE